MDTSTIINVNVTGGNVPDAQYRTVILKPNYVEDVNTLTQAMVNQGNIKYVIKYDFVLGEDITIPANCVLEFEGGSIDCSNYVITGNKMPTNVIYTPEQFGAGKTNDDTKAIRSCINLCSHIQMDKSYNVSFCSEMQSMNDNTVHYIALIPSNTEIILNGTINYLITNLEGYSIFYLRNCENVYIHGFGKLIGDKDIHVGSTGEWGYGIYLDVATNIIIDGLELSKFWGDGICFNYASPYCQNVIIKNIKIHDCRRQGISICAGKNIIVEDFYIYNISGTAPQSAIDIENHTSVSGAIDGIYIRNGKVKNCIKGILNFSSPDDTAENYNVYIDNVYIDDDTPGIEVDWYTVITNCKFNILYPHRNVKVENCEMNTMSYIHGLNTSDSADSYIINSIIKLRLHQSSTGTNKGKIYFIGCTSGRNYNNATLYKNAIFDNCDLWFDTGKSQFNSNCVYNNCNIVVNECLLGGYFHNCNITVELKTATSGGIIYRINEFRNCYIRIMGTTPMAGLYQLTFAGYPITIFSTTIEQELSRTKTYGSNATLTEADVKYIVNGVLQS